MTKSCPLKPTLLKGSVLSLVLVFCFCQTALAQDDSLPKDATGILDLAMKRLSGLTSWKVDVETNQSMSNMEVGIIGSIQVSATDCAVADLRLNLPGIDMPNSNRVYYYRNRVWAEQSLFDNQIVTFANLKSAGEGGFDAMGRMIRAGGTLLNPVEPKETIWWLRRGWDLHVESLDPPELPGTVLLKGDLKALAYAGEAFMHRWQASQAHGLDLYLDKVTLLPRRIRVIDFKGRGVLFIEMKNYELNPENPAASCNSPMPDTVKRQNYTERTREAQEKRDQLRKAD